MAAVNTLPAIYPNVIPVNPIPTTNPNMATTSYTGAPPRYASIVQRVYPHSMRVPLIVIASIGLLWAAVMSASAFRENDDFDSKLHCIAFDGGDQADFGAVDAGSNRTFDIILGILYASVAVLEIYVLVVAVLVSRGSQATAISANVSQQRAALAKFLRILVPVGVVVAIAAQTIALVVHYTTKVSYWAPCALLELILVTGQLHRLLQDVYYGAHRGVCGKSSGSPMGSAKLNTFVRSTAMPALLLRQLRRRHAWITGNEAVGTLLLGSLAF